jgi:hypothetical protein
MKSLPVFLLLMLTLAANGQYMEKCVYNTADANNGYYLAIPPVSTAIRGVLVVFCTFRSPESLLPETKLHNTASAGDLLTVYASLGAQLAADSGALARIDAILQHIATKYKADTATFVLGGFGFAGSIALRYTELANQYPARHPIRPKAVFAVAGTMDLTSLWQTSERQIKRNYASPALGDARAIIGILKNSLGSPADHPEHYRETSPFSHGEDAPGNEQYLDKTAVRLYYDVDINWLLDTRCNSLYDTDIPDGTELIGKLLLAGNKNAEFISSKLPGVRSNGVRSDNAMSIVDETDCIQWIKRTLHIMTPGNPRAWTAPYRFPLLDGWRQELSYQPNIDHPHFPLRSIEELHLPAGWPDAGSEEYWSAAYLFWLDPGQKIDAGILQHTFQVYYDDHIAGAVIRRNLKVAPGTIKPVQVTIKKLAAEPDDKDTYTGTISMFDYLGGKPIILNYFAHLKSCSTQNHIPLFWEISPQPVDHPLWSRLKEMKQKFVCGE